MERPDTAHIPTRQDLLTPEEPPAWEELNSESQSPLLLVCDHASNRVPQQLAHLGLDLNVLGMHVAYDIGCEKLTRLLSSHFNATALLANYSRLVIDLNRHPGDGSSIPEVSDDIAIPGNHALTPDQIRQREMALFWPYHNQIERILGRIVKRGQTPILCSIHSFTPVFKGFSRPWHIGILWDRDQRIAQPMLESLKATRRFNVGDNEPYHARNPVGFTMDVHAEKNGYPHLLMEIRQDLIGHQAGVTEWAEIIHTHLRPILARMTVT